MVYFFQHRGTKALRHGDKFFYSLLYLLVLLSIVEGWFLRIFQHRGKEIQRNTEINLNDLFFQHRGTKARRHGEILFYFLLYLLVLLSIVEGWFLRIFQHIDTKARRHGAIFLYALICLIWFIFSTQSNGDTEEQRDKLFMSFYTF